MGRAMAKDILGTFTEISFGRDRKATFCSLPKLEDLGFGPISSLPFCIRILLESVTRNLDRSVFREDDVRALAGWESQASARAEIPYKPARVVLQDFTGVPSVVDLAAMRDAMKRMGRNPSRINPGIPCHLVIDHSVQVDFHRIPEALELNEEKEFERNGERYAFLKWAQAAFENVHVVPPATGIVHQVNLEYLSTGVFWDRERGLVYPDTCVGTDSHTPMVNGLGVLAWGVGGIEAEAVMLDQPMVMLIPDVMGFRLTGALPPRATATDLVLRITEICREQDVVGKFVEFFGPGVEGMGVEDRATISNMAPEQGCTVSFFPTDERTLEYLRMTGRPEETIDLVERYGKEQGLFRTNQTPEPRYTDTLTLDLSTVEPSIAGPKRPRDRIALGEAMKAFQRALQAPVGAKGFGLDKASVSRTATVALGEGTKEIRHGDVVIAAITSCTNTSNPSVMIGAGLLAKKAVERGLTVNEAVKTSLAPGSSVVTEYLTRAGLLFYLEKLGFGLVGYGCTTCIGNSGPLSDAIAQAVAEKDLVVTAVLSGNRNFEGRINPHVRASYLASPLLVVAFAIAGTMAVDLTTQPLGYDPDGRPVTLQDVWPSRNEIAAMLKKVMDPQMFRDRYAHVWEGSERWKGIAAGRSVLYAWDGTSTYIQSPPFFEDLTLTRQAIRPITNLRVLGLFGDSVTTDHISPAGDIAPESPAGRYLLSIGVPREAWNTYGSRRGNHEVMMRGTFGNIRIKNRLVQGKEGNVTIHYPSGEEMSFFEAAERYRREGTPLLILAGKEYGSGSSRDWAAKGPYLLGVRVVLAEGYERIHRSNLIGMGILPLQFLPGKTASDMGLSGDAFFDVHVDDSLRPGQRVQVSVTKDKKQTFEVLSRIDTPIEVEYYRNGGILQTVLKNMPQDAG